jgi:hypothetical protein
MDYKRNSSELEIVDAWNVLPNEVKRLEKLKEYKSNLTGTTTD